MKKDNIIELNIGVYTSVKLKVNRIIAMTIASKFPQLGNIKNENDIDFDAMYEMSIFALYKMANALDKEFTYEKAEEIFDYAENVVAIVDGEKQPCNFVLMTNILNAIKEVFTKEQGKEVQVVEFKMN